MSEGLDGQLWKYVDDTTASEIVAKGKASNAQQIADHISQWSAVNRVKLNSAKCKELRISFAKNQPEFEPIVVNGKELEIVDSTKLLGVTIANNLSWNDHISEVVKKASKRLYFLVQLKRAKLPYNDLVLFYTTCIRSVLSYAVPVFHYSLPQYLKYELERVQKRALSIICPGVSYNDALAKLGILSLESYNDAICDKVSYSVISDPNNRLHSLLPATCNAAYSLRSNRRFNIPKWKTDRFRNTFIMSSCINNNF